MLRLTRPIVAGTLRVPSPGTRSVPATVALGIGTVPATAASGAHRPVARQPRAEPGEQAGEELLRRLGVVPSVGQVDRRNREALAAGDVQEAIDLGVDVEGVATDVADEHFEFARLETVQVEHLDGVVA